MTLWDKRTDMVVHERDPYNAEPPPAALAGQPLTGIESFYSRNHGPVPDLDPASWRLVVDGMVEKELKLSRENLQTQFATHTLTVTLQCAGNQRAGFLQVRDIPGEDPWGPGATSTAQWTGVRLGDVLAAAGVAGDARHVAFAAPDVSELAKPAQTYGSSIPVAKARSGEVLLAWAMNGVDLPPAHGGPVRVIVGGYIGARSVKWVQRITVQAGPSDNYFQATAYRVLPASADPDQVGPGDGISLTDVALNSAILQPNPDAEIPAGLCEVTGYALAGGGRGIARVDVSVDDGTTWQLATLDEETSPWAWRLWRTTVGFEPGEVSIVACAWDTTAAPQPESPEQLWNPKGYVNNSWPRVHVHVHPAAAPAEQ